MTKLRHLLSLILFVLCALTLRATAQVSPHLTSGYVPQRVYDAQEKRFTDFEAMLAALAAVDVAFVGEQHDDPATHRMERAVLEGLARRRQNVVVALEMFERDVQSKLDDYLAGRSSEEEFLKVARPWPRYATDYRPLVEFARAHRWPVIAGNIPRPLAAKVSKQGLDVVGALPEAERAWAAAEFKCPFDDYYKKFVAVMAEGHPTNKEGTSKQPDKKEEEANRALIDRFYFAQCVKDETMAESIARQLDAKGAARPLVVHFNGAFHSDYRLGTAERVIRRAPQAKVKVVSVVPVANLDRIKVEDYAKRGDYVLFVLKPAEAKPTSNSQ